LPAAIFLSRQSATLSSDTSPSVCRVPKFVDAPSGPPIPFRFDLPFFFPHLVVFFFLVKHSPPSWPPSPVTTPFVHLVTDGLCTREFARVLLLCCTSLVSTFCLLLVSGVLRVASPGNTLGLFPFYFLRSALSLPIFVSTDPPLVGTFFPPPPLMSRWCPPLFSHPLFLFFMSPF